MGKCPFCNRKITYLRCAENTERVSVFTVGGKGNKVCGEYDETQYEDNGNFWYECPECYQQICTSEDDAIEFLTKD